MQHQIANFGQHLLIRPIRLANKVQKGLMFAETRSGATSAAIGSTLLRALPAATVRSNNHAEVTFNPQRRDMRLTCANLRYHGPLCAELMSARPSPAPRSPDFHSNG